MMVGTSAACRCHCDLAGVTFNLCDKPGSDSAGTAGCTATNERSPAHADDGNVADLSGLCLWADSQVTRETSLARRATTEISRLYTGTDCTAGTAGVFLGQGSESGLTNQLCAERDASLWLQAGSARLTRVRSPGSLESLIDLREAFSHEGCGIHR
jgi:hypothetical protein